MDDISRTELRRKTRKTKFPSFNLRYIEESSVPGMTGGDIFLLGGTTPAGPGRESSFRAILACPLCGKQVLISDAQYAGVAPVSCGAAACPGLFRIVDRKRITHLPVS